MPDSYTRDDRSRYRDSYVIWGIVAACVFLALILLGAGMLDKKSLTQPSTQAPATTQSDTQAPAVTEPSSPQGPATTQSDTQAPATGESKAP
jgi:hypothetical protein